MSCCGGGVRPQKVRKQTVNQQTPSTQKTTIQRKLSKNQPSSMQRQYIVPRQQCTKCGYPTMLVNIAGRERMQCSNVNCRIVAQ